jgi:glycine/D-amino acid oxidase-like deaminating enzyme
MVLEAHDVAWGASGRTGGFAVPRFKKNFHTIAQKYGRDAAKLLHAQVVEAVDSIAKTVETFSLSCGFQRDGHLTPAHSGTALEGLRRDVEWLAHEAGDAVPRLLSREETGAVIGSDMYHGACFDPRGACMNAYDYTRGLGEALTARGVPILVGADVKSIRADNSQWLLETDRGHVRARRVIFATNGYTRPLLPGDDLDKRIIPVASSVIATRPLSLTEKKTVLPCRLPVTDSRRLVSWYRLLPNDQLIFGGRGDITGRRDDPSTYRGLERQLAQTFPQIAGIEITERWSGMVAVTLDDFPHIGSHDEGIFYAMGYGGRGVALSSLMGRLLAKWLCGEEIRPGPMASASFKPIPFHRWRVPEMQIMAAYYRLRDKRER